MQPFQSDVRGLRPEVRYPGDRHRLTPAQEQALLAYPLLAATIGFARRVDRNRAQLSPDGAVRCARLLGLACRGLEQLRGALGGVDVMVQLLAGQVALAARELSRDLRRYAAGQQGTIEATLPPASGALLAASEALDPALGAVGQTAAIRAAAETLAPSVAAALTAGPSGATADLWAQLLALVALLQTAAQPALLPFYAAQLGMLAAQLAQTPEAMAGSVPAYAAAQTQAAALGATVQQAFAGTDLITPATVCLDTVRFVLGVTA